MAASTNFSAGNWVWISEQQKAVQILRVDDPLASVYLDMQDAPASIATLRAISANDAAAVNSSPGYVPTVIDESPVVRVVDQWDHIHHYVDENGDRKLPGFKKVGEGATSTFAIDWDTVSTNESVSYFQRLRETNDDNRAISVLKPDTVIQVVSEFNQLLKRR